MNSNEILKRLGVAPPFQALFASGWKLGRGEGFTSINPATGETIASVTGATAGQCAEATSVASETFNRWRNVPAPQRGEFVRQIGNLLRQHKDDLGALVTLETGKILSEGRGEVQEMIDMCDFAVGLSRQLHGLVIASERPEHRLIEQWHPLGPVGVITAFNFPVAVWAWNAMLAAVCGDTVVWKPSPLTPLTAIATQTLVDRVMAPAGWSGVFSLAIGGVDVGEAMSSDPRLPLISATGSCAMGSAVAKTVAARMGRSLLELGGNNAAIVAPSARLDLVVRAATFAAVGTAGQRCTTLRRLIVHESRLDEVIDRMAAAYRSVTIGNPWEDGILMGPLIRARAVEAMQQAISEAKQDGGKLVLGGDRVDRPGFFVTPAIIRAHRDIKVMQRETFAPILYVVPYKELDEAIAINNGVEQGLSSSIFTESLVESERFLSAAGSDCGIANVNIGTSGAEIGGAFGGEKATGGGRESGSDSWKAYMRRQTCTINYGKSLPLAQGVKFDVQL